MKAVSIVLASLGLFALAYVLIDQQAAGPKTADGAASTEAQPYSPDAAEGVTPPSPSTDSTLCTDPKVRDEAIAEARSLAQQVLLPALNGRYETNRRRMFSRAYVPPTPVHIALEFDEVRGVAAHDRTVMGVASVTRRARAVATHRFRAELDAKRVVLLLDDGSEVDVVAEEMVTGTRILF